LISRPAPRILVTGQGLSASSCAGYFELRLCPLAGTTDAAEKKAFSENCLARHPLKVKLPSGKFDTKYWMYQSGEIRASAWLHAKITIVITLPWSLCAAMCLPSAAVDGPIAMDS
jgi:hypothetical protein